MYLQSYHSTKTAKLELRAKRKDLLLDFGTGRLAFGHLRYTKKGEKSDPVHVVVIVPGAALLLMELEGWARSSKLGGTRVVGIGYH